MVGIVEILSKELIKPSLPTPNHLKDQFKFSSIDQIMFPVYFPFLYFYQTTHENHIQKLKDSLSNVLNVFYPLAGQPENNLSSINCNGNGAEFVEAIIHARLSDIIEDPNLDEMEQFVPLEPLSFQEQIVLSIQATLFDCGGVVIGVSLLHKVGDAKSMVEFMRAWAATCHGENELNLTVPPKFNMASHFPPGRDISDDILPSVIASGQQKVVTKRLILDKEKISELKAEIALNPETKLKDPTRVEAASAFVWKQFIDEANKQHIKSFHAKHVVDLRSRMSPPIPETTFGNCIISAMTNEDDEYDKLHQLAYMLRRAVRKIDGDYIKKIQSDGELVNQIYKETQKDHDGMQLCSFTSWCRLPMYEVDYGWGKPLWVCTLPVPLEEFVILMPTPCGEGIEAWINNI